ncbi:alpha/beta hydrolase [Hymenobacter sp. BT186]|uniref:Alpha/beta hydrolase n=1 Tax=Hymenobacter telluris TaxID=2816474 RepID=A0A939EX02_9BACT|nr:alpha/beta hydrolase [Hymenobacter telluris]MBO0358175.1 alpha/beta hydrolase [Hymenobacter telluris]MBW3374202.1 alpha/beta hydrolase [Hymenobacter norwichensis]
MDVLKRNNVTVSGEGKQAMVFVHGFGCNQQMWRLVAPVFAADYRVVLLDLVGAGRSNLAAYDPAHYSSLDAHAEDVLQVLGALDLHDVVLVGHSVGAIIAMLAAIEEPTRVAQLVLVAPSPRYLNDVGYTGGFEPVDINDLLEDMGNNYLGWSGAFTPVVMGQPSRSELTTELNTSFCSTDPAIAQHFARVTFLGDNRADLLLVRTPSLILQCAYDVIAPLAVGTYMHRYMPDSELVVLDTSGHCPHLSVPQATIAAIQQFLRSTPTP